MVPGWGQISTRHRRLGWTLATTSVTSAAAAVVVAAALGPVEMAARLADPAVLLFLLAANLVVAAVRVASTGHAWWAQGGRSVFVATVLAALVLIPHVAVAWVGVEVRHTLLEVFAEPEAVPTVTMPPVTMPPVTATTSLSSSTTTSTSTTTTVVAPVLHFPPEPPPFVPPTTPTTLPPFPHQRLTVLLLGGDAGPGRTGLRTDTIMVASVDTTSGEAALFGLPRNYGGFTFSDGTPFGGILNEVYGWGRANAEAYDGSDPGAAAVRDVAEHLTGLPIDHFVLVDLTGFGDLVDAFGGVTLDVPVPVDGPLYDTETGGYEMIRIPAGSQTLDGGQALAYSRARHGTTDYVRMGRQRCVLAAMVSTLDPVRLLARLPGLLEVVEEHVSTDVPVDLVPHLIRLAARVPSEEIRVVGFDHTTRVGRTSFGHAIPDVDAIRATVQATIGDPKSLPTTVPTVGGAC